MFGSTKDNKTTRNIYDGRKRSLKVETYNRIFKKSIILSDILVTNNLDQILVPFC